MTETLRPTSKIIVDSLAKGTIFFTPKMIERKLQAYAAFKPDVTVLLPIQMRSTHPARILHFPTETELHMPATIASAKIGIEALYWRAVTRSILIPNKLNSNGFYNLLLLPVIYNENNKPQLLYEDQQLGFLKTIQGEHPSTNYDYYIKTLNCGGDGDFYTKIGLGRVEITFGSNNQFTINVRLATLGIDKSLAASVCEARNQLSEKHYDLFIATIMELLDTNAFPRDVKTALKKNKAYHNEFNVLNDLIKKGSATQANIDRTITTIFRYIKKNEYLNFGVSSPVYRYADQLANYLEQMYFVATGDHIFQKYPFSV